MESVVGLWKTYLPSVMNALQPSGQPNPHVTTPTAAHLATVSSFQSYNAPPVERRTPQAYNTNPSYPNLHEASSTSPFF
jgi:hypothetical protein